MFPFFVTEAKTTATKKAMSSVIGHEKNGTKNAAQIGPPGFMSKNTKKIAAKITYADIKLPRNRNIISQYLNICVFCLSILSNFSFKSIPMLQILSHSNLSPKTVKTSLRSSGDQILVFLTSISLSFPIYG